MSTRQRERAARRKVGRRAGNRGPATVADLEFAQAFFAVAVQKGLMEVVEWDANGEPVTWQDTEAGMAANVLALAGEDATHQALP